MTAPPPRPLLLASAPPPLLAGTDAVFHEIETLAEAFGGTVISLHPFADPARRFPMAAMGLTKLPQILGAASRCDLVHVFNPAPYGFPLLRLLRKPVVYTVTAALDPPARSAAMSSGAVGPWM